MRKLDKLSVGWKGLLDAMTDVVHNWRPPLLKGEVKYRDHLLAALREHLPADTKIEKEFRHLGTTIDIWLQWTGILMNDEVAFELKVNLQRKTDYDRLVGQIEGMNPAKQKIIVVLIGHTNDGLLGRLTERYAKYTETIPGRTMSIVNVPIEG